MSECIQYRLAFDIGGTFTDIVLLGNDGRLHTAKVLSDPVNVVAPIAEAVQRLCHQHGIGIASIQDLIVGATTAITNLVIERKGARTALIATKGFRDVVAIGRELRYDLYNLKSSGPDPIIDRRLRLEIHERIDTHGVVVIEPSVENIRSVIQDALEQGTESIAVSLLHSFTNPKHELMVRDIAQSVDPALPVSLSHEVLGELREYERTICTILNAYVMPKVGDYLSMIESGLREIGLKANLRVMQSNGGVISKSFGQRFPVRLLESGPAAGALGASHTARLLSIPNLVAFDMGGTTAKACLIDRYEPGITTEFEAARTHRFKKGSGLPVRIPTVDLIEIGAGGGSIAHIDNTGLLKVGPHSSGSQPGPACYGLGGVHPTVTDAALLLGYFDPAANLSDAVQLRYELASQSMSEHIAQKLGLSIHEAAAGVHRIVCEQMAAAAKIHAVEKAKDIRQSTLLAFGGAGPLHAREVARRTGSKRIVVPSSSGVFSAYGLLVAPMKIDIVRTRYLKLGELDLHDTELFLQKLENQLRIEFERKDIDSIQVRQQTITLKSDYRFVRTADMRYIGQGFEVATPLPEDLTRSSIEALKSKFETQYQCLFGSPIEGAGVEILNWRVEASAGEVHVPHPPINHRKQLQVSSSRSRKAYFPCIGSWIETAVISESDLIANTSQLGPALIEQAGSTVVVGPGDTYHKDDFGNIHLLLKEIASS